MEAVVDGDDSTKVGSVGVVRWGGGRGRHTVIGAVTIVVERAIPDRSHDRTTSPIL